MQQKLSVVLHKHQVDKWREKKKNISHAFEKKKSIITNARIHRNKRFVLNIDLEGFFESFHFGRVRGFFNKNNNLLLPIEVATVIAQLSCYQGKLPQGAPSSPVITNLICEILDLRLLKIARKYRLNYTRYADDLTFSTNDKNFLEHELKFHKEIANELKRSGFDINKNKTRLQFKDSRQVVTGLVVNQKVNVPRDYYKNTRAMAHKLYTQGHFEIDEEEGTVNQLEGRFSFINQLDWYNNKRMDRNNKDYKYRFNNFKSSEREYQKFLFYKYFYATPKPLIVTEGKTDITYLKSALKNLYRDYPNLITKKTNQTFEFHVSFLKKSKRLDYFLNINRDGAEALKNIYYLFSNKGSIRNNYSNYFKDISPYSPSNPVILLFDNELVKGKPLQQIMNEANFDENSEEMKTLKEKFAVKLVDNLYLFTVPLVKKKLESDIEDLFDKATLSHKIHGKEFNRKNDSDNAKYYGKERFSQHISKNYSEISFDNFRSILDNISETVKKYTNE